MKYCWATVAQPCIADILSVILKIYNFLKCRQSTSDLCFINLLLIVLLSIAALVSLLCMQYATMTYLTKESIKCVFFRKMKSLCGNGPRKHLWTMKHQESVNLLAFLNLNCWHHLITGLVTRMNSSLLHFMIWREKSRLLIRYYCLCVLTRHLNCSSRKHLWVLPGCFLLLHHYHEIAGAK